MGDRHKNFEDQMLLSRDMRTPKFKSAHFYCAFNSSISLALFQTFHFEVKSEQTQFNIFLTNKIIRLDVVMRQNKILQSESTDRLLLLIAIFSSPSLITALQSSSPIGKSGGGIVQTELAI